MNVCPIAASSTFLGILLESYQFGLAQVALSLGLIALAILFGWYLGSYRRDPGPPIPHPAPESQTSESCGTTPVEPSPEPKSEDLSSQPQTDRLMESENRYQALFNSLHEGCAVLEVCPGESTLQFDLIILAVNPTVERLTGLPSERLIGQSLLRQPAVCEEEWFLKLQKVARTQQSQYFVFKDDRLDRHFEATAFGISPGRIAVVFTDITRRWLMEKERERLLGELEQKNRDLEEIIFVISHDLRSPLVNIQGFSQRLNKACTQLLHLSEAQSLPESVQTECKALVSETIPTSLEFIVNSASRMDALLGGLLRLARIGKAPIRMESVDMNLLIESILANLSFQILEVKAHVETSSLPPCRGDALQLYQVFSNLLDNALKYRRLEVPLQLRIHAVDKGDRIHYCIEDNGKGIAEEHQAKVWELFHRLEPSGPVIGEGLGLTITKRIVERHGGQIWMESQIHTGSRFWISLPAANSDREQG